MSTLSRRGFGESAQDGGSTRHRLEAWNRYAKALDDQASALASDPPDLDRFAALAKVRESLAHEIDAMGAWRPSGAEAGRALAGLRRCLEDCRARDRSILDRLRELREGKAGAIRTFDDRRRGRAGYIAGMIKGAKAVGKRCDIVS